MFKHLLYPPAQTVDKVSVWAGNVSPRCVDVALYIAINKCCSISLVTPYKSQQCQLWLCRVCGTPSNSSFIPLHANWKYHQLLLGPIIAAQKGV